MSKKTPAKKTRRRLKRSVRRSLAAVLMITAIAVAAIPVQENYADSSATTSTNDDPNYPYQTTATASADSGWPYESCSDPVYSLIIRDNELVGQYKIDPSTSKVVQYIATYPDTELSLVGSVPTSYKYVTQTAFEEFLNASTSTFTITVKNYDPDNSDKEATEFFNSYDQYKDAMASFLKKVEDYQKSQTDTSITAEPDYTLTGKVSDLNFEDQAQYYCKKNKMSGDTLVKVKLSISGDSEIVNAVLKQLNPQQSSNSALSQNMEVYIPQYAGTGEADATIYDSNKFRYNSYQTITKIGDYAFAGNGTLAVVSLPDDVKTIGKGAFMKCGYLTKVNIPFLHTIPDYAFYGCNNLATVDWYTDANTSNLETIGTEAFYGTVIQESKSGSGVLKFPNLLYEIGDAAFYQCNTQSIEFESSTTGLVLNKYAFFDNTALSSLKFNDNNIKSIGDYCFAVGISNSLESFTFPNSALTKTTIGKKILANRSQLRYITVPEKVTSIPGGILSGCTGLVSATFNGVNTSYDNSLFDDVSNDEFYVTGYATMDTNAKKDDVSNASNPRRSTWEANKTAADQYIPYKYTLNGKDYFEVCSGEGFLECIEKNSDNKTGTLTSVSLKDGISIAKEGELVIPDQVGGYQVTKIASGCFTGKSNITGRVKSLTVGNYIQEIGDSVFKSWPILKEVEIGKSIQKIGNNAFADCTSLEDVTFVTPDNNNYSTLTIGTDAFATNSGKLTIHGDLVDGYAPFEYAVDPNNYVGTTLASGSKYRILYQSRWDSPSSKHMSVLYGDYDDGNGYVTLVDYPLYKDFFDSNGANLRADLVEHNEDMQTQFYNSYGNYSYPTTEDKYLEKKVKFAVAYKTNSTTAYDAKDADGEDLYGPWINPAFCKNYDAWTASEWTSLYSADASGTDSGLFDWLFEPLTVEAADAPTAYFEKHPYNFLKNYMNYDGDSSKITCSYIDGWTQDEEAMLKSYENIVIPAGVESIDIKGYYDAAQPAATDVASNKENYILYFGDTSGNSRRGEFVYGVTGSKAGLFRASIDDLYTEDTYDALGNLIDKTTTECDYTIGNDRIKSVDMSNSDVAYLPDYAFENCQLLESVSIPASCKTTGVLPFKDCGNLTTLTSASEDVPAQNGLLYQKKDDASVSGGDDYSYELVECILGKGLSGSGSTISAASDDPYISRVSSIGESAFEDCTGITRVDLSSIDNGASANKLQKIPDSCFKNCDGLTFVDLPTTTTELGHESFANIREDYYYGRNSKDGARLTVCIRGNEFNVSEDAFDPKKDDINSDDVLESTIDLVNIYTYEDTAAERYALEMQSRGYDVRLQDETNSEEYLSKLKKVYFVDYDGTLLGNVYLGKNEERIDEDEIPSDVQAAVNEDNHRPGYKFTGWKRSDGEEKFSAVISGDSVTFYAQYESDGTLVNGKYAITFVDGIDGSTIFGPGAVKDDTRWVYYIDPLPSGSTDKLTLDYVKNATNGATDMPTPPTHDGYTFLKWVVNQEDFDSSKTVLTPNMTIIALYAQNSGDGSTTSGGSTTTSGGSTTTSGSSGSTSGKSSSTSSSGSSTSGSSTSTSSTTSGSNSTAGTYTVTVINGSGSGTYATGSTVIIIANDPAAGMKFSNWTTDSNGVSLTSSTISATTFTMPANNVSVTANYEASTGTSTSVASTGSTGTTDNGGTRVDITKPGISNKDLATANVNGSTDNFVVKIAETDEATQAVANALTNKYGSLDNILYYAMDITLWDSTGTYQITDAQAEGLSVDITIPIPDALVTYGGNNMAGAVINENQLESLNENFTTINGVPCIRFTATHFSPYTIYVDTGNLTEGLLDTTPKTGDPIHPKWFLSLGLACLSIILFMKKDKNVKVKTA